ncbi:MULTISPECIES: hypothetical protein [Corynebacterium]|uniref:hypothetical protein n=1 Tax=Corynebacterium TaxID=1716 RepID=UPI00068BFFAF|nr:MULTISPECIES: hypothetical protein [Corynebacterium]MDK8891341.1 hypothetical protein [Corynebacterium macclintockiae]OFM58179.1 hypothetical protein HMPREF2678_08485 [Corynebacterium sp. HMSC058E07]
MNTATWILAQAERTGPKGAEFGKAAPIGLFVIVILLLVVLLIGFAMNKRIRRLERRRAFADARGIDLFDTEKLEAAMKAEGFDDTAGKRSMFARTEVPQTDERFLPASGTLTGPAAIDAERARAEGVDKKGAEKNTTPDANSEEPPKQ